MAPGRYSTFFRSSVDLPRSQSSCPVEASRLHLTHASERAAGAQASSTPTAINQTERRKENIRIQQSLLIGHQLKPEQCSKRSGSQGQSEPLIFEGADHVASAAAPINRAFSKKPPSTSVLPGRCGRRRPQIRPGQLRHNQQAKKTENPDIFTKSKLKQMDKA